MLSLLIMVMIGSYVLIKMPFLSQLAARLKNSHMIDWNMIIFLCLYLE